MTAVRSERDGPLAIITFDHPPLNLFDATLVSDLMEAVLQVDADRPRALLICAQGSVVSGGVDVHDFKALEGPEQARAMFDRLFELEHTVERFPFPTVFAAHALCLTAAFELSLACDLLLAAESAGFGLVERVVGLTPAMGGTQRLAERAGPARAREFVYSGRVYDAATMERWNVVNEVRPDEGFAEWAQRYAMRLANGPTIAHGATKRIVRAYLEGGVQGADAVTPEIAAELFSTSDLENAIESFLADGPGKATYEGR